MIYDKAISNFPCAIWLKEIRDDEFEQTNNAIPQLVSLVRTLEGVEIQEAVTAVVPNSTEAHGSFRVGDETSILMRRQAG